MEITEVKVFPVRDKKLRAFVSIVFDGSFMVNDIKVIEGRDGLFISMPSRRKKNGRFKDIAHPLNQETRKVLEDRIVAEYRQAAENGEGLAQAGDSREPSGEGQQAVAASAGRPERPPRRDEDRLGAAVAERPRVAPDAARPRAATDVERPRAETDVERPRAAADGERDTASADEKSLEEIAEDHLSDSYWTT